VPLLVAVHNQIMLVLYAWLAHGWVIAHTIGRRGLLHAKNVLGTAGSTATMCMLYPTVAAGVEGRLCVLTSFKAAASAQDWPLAWASCPLLEPDQQLPAVLSMPLGFRSPPAFARVLAHVQQVRLGCMDEHAIACD
jgi:hypothetical protein